MEEVFLGEIIRRRRQDLNLTQEQLSEGICEQATISRFENGTQTPSRNRIKALLQRLGLPENRFYALLTKNEEQIRILRDEISSLAMAFELASDEERPLVWEKVMNKMTQLEAIIEPGDFLMRQYILSIQATVGKIDRAYSPEEKIALLMEAVHITIPGLDLEDLQNFRYNTEELQLINKIARAFSHMGQRRKAIDIYRQLLSYVEKNNLKLTEYAAQFGLIAHNYAIQLSAEKQYEEAVEIASKGWMTCVKYRHYRFLPGFLAILAENCYFMGDNEKSTKFFIQAYYLYEVITDDHNRAIIQKEMKEYLGLEPPY